MLLETERERLSDWHLRLEDKTRTEASRLAQDRATLNADRESYRESLRKAYDREIAVNGRESRVGRREKAVAEEETHLNDQRTLLETRRGWLEERRTQLDERQLQLDEIASRQSTME